MSLVGAGLVQPSDLRGERYARTSSAIRAVVLAGVDAGGDRTRAAGPNDRIQQFGQVEKIGHEKAPFESMVRT